MFTAVKCTNCQKKASINEFTYKCPACGGIMEIEYNYENDEVARFIENMKGGFATDSIWDFQELLPLQDLGHVVSLQEGDTPVFSVGKDLYIKDETRNPTGSFKDRPLSVAISKAKEMGYRSVITSTQGNAGVSCAAYAARGGLRCFIIVPKYVDQDKLVMMQAFGAEIKQIDGDFSDAYNLSLAITDQYRIANMATTFLSPYTIEGDKTIAFELYKQFKGTLPEWITFPIGAGPLLAGCYKGFQELIDLGLLEVMPKLVAVQSDECAPIYQAFIEGRIEVTPWTQTPKTVAVGISDPLRGYPEDGTITLQRVRQSEGLVMTVDDHQIIAAMNRLSKEFGILTEPTGAVAYAGMLKMLANGQIPANERVLAILSGGGYKELKAYRSAYQEPEVIDTDIEAFGKLL